MPRDHAGTSGRRARPSAAKSGRVRATVRIIGGCWRRAQIVVPEIEGLRPTADRVRETLFNWLGPSIQGMRCLDLFAGTAALGLEAASRGAAEVVLVEPAPAASVAIERSLASLAARRDPACAQAAARVRLMHCKAASALERLRATGARLDLVFLDPPFAQALLAPSLRDLLPLLADGALLYVEAGEAQSAGRLSEMSGGGAFTLRRSGKAGIVHYHLFEFRQLACDEQTEHR